MAVTKQTYTATATWTASQLADIFQSAFIDAGLMTDWHDSFLSGSVQNRILRVVHDGTKTYGATFYWFQFTTSGAYLQIATGWNTTTKVPIGTQYLDFVSTTTNSANGWQLLSASSTSTAELVRYSSNVDPQQNWFVFKSNSLRKTFTIQQPFTTLQNWLDLDKGIYSGFIHTDCTTGSGDNKRYGVVGFLRGPALRRDLVIGTSLRGSTSVTEYNNESAKISCASYAAVGNESGNFTVNIRAGFAWEDTFGSGGADKFAGSFILPCNFSNTNPAFTTNTNPVFHSMPISAYTTNSLSPDFGLTFHYATNSFSAGDTFVVNAGVEEWEVLDFSANNSAVTGASPLFLARTI